MELPEFGSPAMVPRGLKNEFRQHSERCRILRSIVGERVKWLRVYTFLLTRRLELMAALVEHYDGRLIEAQQAELTHQVVLIRQRQDAFAGILDRYRQHMTAALKIIPHWDEETRQQAVAMVASVTTAIRKQIR